MNELEELILIIDQMTPEEFSNWLSAVQDLAGQLKDLDTLCKDGL